MRDECAYATRAYTLIKQRARRARLAKRPSPPHADHCSHVRSSRPLWASIHVHVGLWGWGSACKDIWWQSAEPERRPPAATDPGRQALARASVHTPGRDILGTHSRDPRGEVSCSFAPRHSSLYVGDVGAQLGDQPIGTRFEVLLQAERDSNGDQPYMKRSEPST